MATTGPQSILHEADTLHMAGSLDAAAAMYRQVLELDEALVEAWYGLGRCQLSLLAYGAAADTLARAVALRPDAAGARCNLAEALFQLGRVDEAAVHYMMAAKCDDDDIVGISLDALASIAPGVSSLDNAAVLNLRQHWAARIARQIQPLRAAPRETYGKLRIGYLSAYFGARNWMKPVFGVINQHDRDRFEIHLLSDGVDPCEASGYVDHAEDRIWRIANLTNDMLARHIAQAGLDVLVDLNGYSVQRRLPLFLHRPARCHIGWFNMFATTGMSAFDYLVADDAVLPSDEAAFYCERIHRVPGSYLAFNVRYPVPDVAAPSCVSSGTITFGCLGAAYKLTDATIDAWSHILAGAPGARLLLKYSTFNDASSRDAMRARFVARGVAPDRLLFEVGAEHFDFLRGYERIDIALDTFPYNGGTTTSEALWQGVPVLSFNGDRWASRTSRSLLLAAGLKEWVADDVAGYVESAIRIARDAGTPGRLRELRATMRSRLQASPVCDCAALCRALEALYLSAA